MKRKDMISFVCITCYIGWLYGFMYEHFTMTNERVIERVDTCYQIHKQKVDMEQFKRLDIDMTRTTHCYDDSKMNLFFIYE